MIILQAETTQRNYLSMNNKNIDSTLEGLESTIKALTDQADVINTALKKQEEMFNSVNFNSLSEEEKKDYLSLKKAIAEANDSKEGLKNLFNGY